jgi:hypothetical protein
LQVKNFSKQTSRVSQHRSHPRGPAVSYSLDANVRIGPFERPSSPRPPLCRVLRRRP